MVKKAAGAEKPARKSKRPKSVGGTKKGKVSPYNKFMKEELARLKESDPDMKHPERFKIAATNWAKAKENPKNAK
ncbi:uncharacterized protein FOMMEDRAFT_167076 [Fomitiporia mediterranea MF3/22]|uniref:uncharacterized protein n=1 Tax=Fomitiporia mediterranea (strain MF3/22) TaxID=694068 RepID=UPI0004407668|nr:uncharacterized protein FOMMEDRAFT_167076 [Fomitiporia mediterranea MF3/22]EJD03751.1 hypothetical protein FOMMEDRAFT_167076 [Fomitiporia mediterranea MF3/22]